MNENLTQRPVGGVILAAGASERMGCPKLLLSWGGTTIIGQVLENAVQAGLDDLLLVSGAEREQVEAEAASRGVRCVYNPDYRQGQSTSLKRGLAALKPGCAALFLLGDQPLIGPEIISELLLAYRRGNGPIVIPRGREGVRGNPSLFAPELFDELRQLEGDVGGRPVLRRHLSELCSVEIGGLAVLTDVDTPEQYRELASAVQQQ